MSPQGSGFHESADLLSPRTQDLHRALLSLMEELEAIDWYAQRMEVTADPELEKILDHNRKEEIEHAVMVLEWIRRLDPVFDEEMRKILFREGSIAEREGKQEEAPGEAAGDGDLRIRSLGSSSEGRTT